MMARTKGYVGTIESETRNVSRIWFSLTGSPNANNWIKIGANRAWFTMSMETADRPSEMAKLTLLLEAMRSDLPVQVSHGGTATNFIRRRANDAFEVEAVGVLRSSLHF